MAEYPTLEERTAARRYLEHDHAAHTLGGAAAREANRNAQEIDDEHERARDIALTGTERELGELSKPLRAHQSRRRKEAGITSDHAARIRAAYRAGPPANHERHGSNPRPNHTGRQGAPRADRRPSRGGRRSSRGGFSGAYDTATGSTGGQLVAQFFAWGMGLSLLYLFLTHDRAAAGLFTGAATVARSVVATNIDPLNPKGVPGAARAVRPLAAHAPTAPLKPATRGH